MARKTPIVDSIEEGYVLVVALIIVAQVGVMVWGWIF